MPLNEPHIEEAAPVHGKQLLTYLRLMNLPVGLLINFGGSTLKEGLQRVVNHLTPSASPRLFLTVFSIDASCLPASGGALRATNNVVVFRAPSQKLGSA